MISFTTEKLTRATTFVTPVLQTLDKSVDVFLKSAPQHMERSKFEWVESVTNLHGIV